MGILYLTIVRQSNNIFLIKFKEEISMDIIEDNSMKNMRFVRKLPIPKEVKELFPLSEKAAEIKKFVMQKFPRYSREKVRSFCL